MRCREGHATAINPAPNNVPSCAHSPEVWAYIWNSVIRVAAKKTMSQVLLLLLLLLVLLSSTTSSSSDNANTPASPVHVVGQFVLGFTDAAVSDVVWVSGGEEGGGGGLEGALKDEDVSEVNR